MHDPRQVSELARAFDVGHDARLSSAPVARGRQGDIWLLETECGRWAVKTLDASTAEADVTASASFQEAAVAAGVPAPMVLRTSSGSVIHTVDTVPVRVYEWVDLDGPDPEIDPRAVGTLLAALHRVEHAGPSTVDPWFFAPVGERRWAALTSELARRGAPFADELAAKVPELLALEQLLDGPPSRVRTCHRDLWADNLRTTPDGGLCVVDFENCGAAAPAQELAMVAFEYCSWSAERAAALLSAYVDAGGTGRLRGPSDFAMAVAVQGHIVEIGCRRWLAAENPEDRADNEAWVREFIDRPLDREVIDRLLAT